MTPASTLRGQLDWRRLVRRALLLGPATLALVGMYAAARGGHYGSDFRGGTWTAAHAVLAGRSPYVRPDVATLLAHSHAFVTPPPLALVAAPLALLPFPLAAVIWSAACAAGLVGGLYLLGVRDRRLYLVAFCSFPFVSSLLWGHPDGLLALGAALAWRYRDSRRGAIAVAALIATKLLAWPLLAWLLVTRRVRSFRLALGSTVALLALSWASIGFKGLAAYPRLLAADARAWQERSYSVVSAFMRAGAPELVARGLAIAVAGAIAFAVVRAARGSDRGWFVAALAFGLLSSPLVELSYLTILFVPLAIWRPRLDRLWLLPAALWLSPPGVLPQNVQIALVLAILSAVAIRSASVRVPTFV